MLQEKSRYFWKKENDVRDIARKNFFWPPSWTYVLVISKRGLEPKANIVLEIEFFEVWHQKSIRNDFDANK